jgi:hypothetical protein
VRWLYLSCYITGASSLFVWCSNSLVDLTFAVAGPPLSLPLGSQSRGSIIIGLTLSHQTHGVSPFMTLVRFQGTKAAVRTLRSSARHTQARILVSGCYQGSCTCLSWMNSSALHLESSTSILVGSSTPLHIIVQHHLPRPPPRPAQAESSQPLPNDTPLPAYGPAVEVSMRIFY